MHDAGGPPVNIANHLWVGKGELARRMRALDWEATPLGPPDTWPQSLRSALSICLGSAFPIAIYWGPTLALLYNDAWSPIPGSKHPWSLGRPAREVWPEIWDAIGPQFEQVLGTGEATYSEDSLLLMRRHGYTEECYFNFTFSPIIGESGRVEGIFNAVNETTFRVLAERRSKLLRSVAERLAGAATARDVCERSVQGLCSEPRDAPFCALYLEAGEGRFRREALAGVCADDPAFPLFLSEAKWPLPGSPERVLRVDALGERLGAPLPGGPWPEPAREALVATLNGSDGAVSGYLILGASPRRAVDDDYRQFAERAAAHVSGALNVASAYERERARAEQLAELDRAKTTFFSNVSHEFRTPLALMLAPLEDLIADARAAVGPEERAQLQTVHRNALRLLKLVNTLLDFSRVESGRTRARFEPVALDALTAELCSAFQSVMERAELRYELACEPLSQPVFVDVGMWEKVVFNLLSNALKFTFEGGVTVRLREVDGAAELTVSDTGTGIPAEELPNLFRRFHRVEGARTRSFEGSGIGLALVRELVHMHGGTIEADSAAGRGTTFKVRVPLAQQSEASAAVAQPGANPAAARPYLEEAQRWLKVPVSAPPAPEAKPALEARVLLAEDNADMREYVTRLLSQEGLEVVSVGDGLSALERLRTSPFDLLVTDVMMPRLDGFGLLAALRTDPRLQTTPVIMLSARAGEEAQVDGMNAGADDYLVKPFSARELVARVRRHLVSARMRSAAASERDRLRALLGQVPAVVNFFRGPDLVFEYVHPLALAHYGGREALGRPLLEVFPEFEDQEFPDLLRRVLETGERFSQQERPVRLADGKGGFNQSYWSSVYVPVRDPQGRTEGVMTFDIEVTEAVQARERLQEALRQRDEFLSIAGHELNTPLTALRLQLDVAEKQAAMAPPPPNQLERLASNLAKANRGARRLSLLVDELLDVARLSTGRMQLNLEDVDAAELVHEVAERLAETAQKAGSTVTVAVEPVIGHWDRLRLEQVVSNLITNAIKYGGGKPISVALRRDGAHAVLSVRDEGIGIAPEDQRRIFQRFERAVSGRHYGGFGLGLWISGQIISSLGGEIAVVSEQHRGSEFTVRLPAKG